MTNITLISLLAGGLYGLLSGAGIFTIAGALGGMWLGNAVSGIVDGHIQTLLGQSADPNRIIEKEEEPILYMVEILAELAAGTMGLLVTINPPA